MDIRKKVLKTFCTTQEAAIILGVSLRTVQLWTESGLLDAWKTSGGHRRIARQSIERLLLNPGQVQTSVSKPSEAPDDDEAASTSRRFSILVVEDDADLRDLYTLNLTRWPMRPAVTTAGDGYEALIRMGTLKPDLLITDLIMAGMDGFLMLEAIHNMTELANTTVVVVTGIDASEIKNYGTLAPDTRVLPKPVPFGVIRTIAEKLAYKADLRLAVT